MNSINTTVAERWQRFLGAARLVAAAALVCAGAQAQAQSFYLDDRDLSPNIIRVNAPQGTDVSGITPTVISGSTTIQNNVTYSLTGSALFEVNAATGAIRSASAFDNSHLGHYPVTLTATHGGETDDFSLHIGVHPVGGFYICDRTAPIRGKILEGTADADVCGEVSTEAMAAITEVDIRNPSVESGTLLDYDFWGMSGLQTFTMLDNRSLAAMLNRITSLPPDVFSDLDSLSRVVFRTNFASNYYLSEFPARLLADLERSDPIDFSINLSVEGRRSSSGRFLNDEPRISGIRYHLDGIAVADALTVEAVDNSNVNRVFTEMLMLDEGVRHNLEIEVVGGVRSTLTLVFRGDEQLPITVTPPTIRIPPFSNRATVVLEAPAGMDFGERQAGTVWLVWDRSNFITCQFCREIREEIRTPDLRVVVRDSDRLEDTDPAPNQISEEASAGDSVSGWSPQVLVGHMPAANARYSLSSDAGGLFEIDAMTGALLLASGQSLDYTASSSHEVTVVAQADSLTVSLTALIEVTPVISLRDDNPVVNSIAAAATVGTPVVGVMPVFNFRGSIVTDGVVYSLTGPDLFAVNTTSGVISLARPFRDGDVRAHSVTLMATYQGNPASLTLTIDVRNGFSICDRTRGVRDAIVEIISSAEERYDCNFVPTDALASITTLNAGIRLSSVSALLPHDFDGLSGLEELDLGNNQVSPLPEGIFDGLSNLRVLNLRDSRSLTTLPPDSLANLDRLQTLHLPRTSEFMVPARLLADLEKSPPVAISALDDVRIGGLQYRLDGVPITEPATETTVVKLDEGVRQRLQVRVAGGVRSTLTLVARHDAELPFMITAQTIEFSPRSNEAVIELMAPPDLNFADSIATTADEVVSWGAWNMLRPSEGVTEIRTQGWRVSVSNTETLLLEDADPSPNTIGVGASEGAPVAGMAPTVRVGRADGTVVLADGVRYALDGPALFGVNSTSGVIFSRQALRLDNLGRHPVTLTAAYRNGVASLPLVIGVNPDGGFDICGRTPVVRDEILRLVNEGGGTHRCGNVPSASLASIQTLDFSANPATDVRTLLVDDFQGLSGLTGLNLRALGLQRLPPDIFRSLAGLNNLDLSDNDNLTELPPRLLADLERLPAVTAVFDAGVRIGGVQYRAGGETVTGLALDEEESRNIRIEVVGGVHSTLTLVARTSGASPPTVTPAVIRFSPFSGADAVTVDVTAPEDPDFENSTGSVSWAWTMFSAAGAATEIRMQTLRLDVRELDIFEDGNPAPNEISEAAPTGAIVSGWSPQVRVDGVIEPAVSYALQPDAGPNIGNLFRIDSATGALSLVAERALDYAMSSAHEITVVARVADSGATAMLAVTIEVTPGFVFRDTDSLANTIAATAERGTPVGGLAVAVRDGDRTLSGVVYSLVGPDFLEVNRASGEVSAARPLTGTDVGPHAVTMTASHSLGVLSLPLTIEVRDGISICDRTRQIRDAIVELINIQRRSEGVTYNCHAVLPAHLESISALTVDSQDLAGVTALLAHDFSGMPALETLNLNGIATSDLPEGIFSGSPGLRTLNLGGTFRRRGLQSLPANIFGNLRRLENLDLSFSRFTSLPGGIFSGLSGLRTLNLDVNPFTSLPQDIFRGTTNLRALTLAGSGLTSLPPDILMNLDRLERIELGANDNLTELPARLLADLENLPTVTTAGFGVGYPIGGIQYRVDGVTTTALALSEGESRNLQVEAVGGVGSTLTLVFRTGAESRLTATPETIRLTASRSTAAVTLAAPPDLNIGDRSGPASWAWEMFRSPRENDVSELRTPGLQVSVRDTHRFGDTDPAPNEIIETASPGDRVSGWSPQVVVGGETTTEVSYRLSSDAGGLFAIDAGTGALSLAPGQALNYATAPAHPVTVIARVTDSGTTASLTATIEVVLALFLSDTDSSANTIAATATAGASVAGVAPQATLVDGGIVTEGVVYALSGSGLFTVNPASGMISAAQPLTEANAGDYPVTLTATYRGSPAHLPLTIEVFDGVSVCERTPVIRDEIMRLINRGLESPYACGFVPPVRLASISTLSFSRRLDNVTALRAGDFAGMTGLQELDLGFLGSGAANGASLPDGIFRDTASLRVLNLQSSRLTPLPPRLLADLERPPRVTAGFDARVLIGGIQYLLNGAAITAPLTLNEGDRTSLQIRAGGGVHSTLTLVFQADGAPLVAAPATVEIGPNTNTAVVELTALPDPGFADSGGQVSWAWEMFDPAAGGATGVRTQSLQVDVRVTDALSLEDADPAPSIIAVSAATGTNVAGVAPTVRVGAVVVTTGVEYSLAGSALFAARSTSGAIFSTRLVRDADRGNHRLTLTASYRGVTDNLPLTVTVGATGNFYICDRTPVVQNEILRLVNEGGGIPRDCANVPSASLASINTLDFSGYSTTVETLLVYDFDGLPGLTNLNLGFFRLQRLPPGVFRGLSNLSRLSLVRNNLVSLPPDIFRGLSNLSRLSLDANNLVSLPPDIFRGLSNLSRLSLNANNLVSLPPDIFRGLSNLSRLSLNANNLASLPSDIFSGLTNLSSLALDGNNLASLPSDIFSGLTNLSSLLLGGNNLATLPPGIFSGLTNLSDLLLGANNLASLPPGIFSDLANLSSLYLDGNNLASLPPGIFSTQTRLITLSLRRNSLTTLPPDIFSGLTRLVFLELRGNANLVLPARAALDLETPPRVETTPRVTAAFDADARLGVEYYPINCNGRPNREAVTELALNEGDMRRIRVQAAGDFRGSTLTLALRAEGAPPPTVTPETLRFSDFSAAFVDLTASTGSVAWAWTRFNAFGAATTEIRTPSLRVNVPGRNRIEDANPSPNQISETAAADDLVSGWRPRVVVDGAIETAVRYSLSDDAGGLFRINAARGGLSLVSEGRLDYTRSTSHQVTVEAEATACGTMAPSLTVVIEVIPFLLSDADPSTNTIAATAATGTRVAGITPVARAGGAVVTDGVMYSLDGPDLFAVNTASGVITAARQLTGGDAGAHPVTLTAIYQSGSASLPLAIQVFPVVSICDRTPEVRDEILRVLNSRSAGAAHTCDVVPPADLASISTLNVPRQRLDDVPTLLAHDFAGMPVLADLRLGSLGLTGLPEDIFRDTTNLRVLSLEGNRLTSLPPGIFRNLGELTDLNLSDLATTGLPETVFSGSPKLEELILLRSGLTSLPPGILRNLDMLEYLELSFSENLTELPAPLLADLEKIGPPPVLIGLDTEASRRFRGIETSRRIGGIRYRLDGATTTALTLNEGESRNLQVEAVGDIRSTLTLAFRTGAASRLAAAPATVEFTPSRRSVAVTLTAPPDLNTGDRSGPVSWVWAFLGHGLTELPAPDLQVSVRDTHRFDDADPAPNRIGETAPAGVAVSGWSPQVVVDGNPVTDVSYRLSSDAGGLFEIDTASGVLSLAPGQVLNHATTPVYPVTVIAQVTGSGTTASLAATIEVFTLALEDTDPASNIIAATAAPGTPVSGVRPVLLVDGAAVADGVFYTLTGSGLFTVHSTSGVIYSAGALDGGSGSHPVTLTATYLGAPADLPLTIIVRSAAGFDICDRTPVVREEILYRVNTQAEVRSLGIQYGCASVPTTRMVSVQRLDFSRSSTTVETLRADDFDGLSGLTNLNLSVLGLRSLPPGIFSGLTNLSSLSLSGNNLASLPPGIFSGLTNLSYLLLGGNNLASLPPGIFSDLANLSDLFLERNNLASLPSGIFSAQTRLTSLSLSGNDLTSLPPDVFSGLTSLRFLELEDNADLVLPAQAAADLERTPRVTAVFDAGVRINGLRFHAPPGSTFFGNLLALEEGDRLNLRLEAIGGVRSTLTLVLRLDNDDPQFTVTPPTVRFSPLSNTDTAVVEFAAPVDETIDSASAGMSWAWTMFGGQPPAATEIRTQLSLGVIVNDNSGLVDTDPADNRISEAALPGDLVSGWSPQLVVDRVTETAVRYRLSQDAGGLFQIHPVNGTLSLASGRLLDYRNSPAHTVRVVARAGGGDRPLTTTILVDNVEELSLSGAVAGSIPETAATGTVVSGLGVSLLDEGVPVPSLGEVGWSLSGAGSQVFQPDVRGSVAVLELVGALDYETTPVYTLALRAAYQRESATTQITVRVLDAAESLTLEAAGPYQIGEDALPDALVGSVRTIDETGTPLTGGVRYTATGDGKFTVTNAGDILVAGQLDFEASTSHTLFITALQGRLVSNQLRVDIAVLDIANDLQLVDQSSAENIASNTTGGRVRGLDLVFQIDGVNQAGAASAWRLLPADAALFDINSATGAITLRRPLAVVPADFTISVAATWTGGDGVPRTPPPLPMNIEINDGIPVRIRVFLEGAVIP